MPKADSLILIHIFQPLSEGTIIDRRKYPLHLTALAWFNIGIATKQVILKKIGEVTDETAPFEFETKGEALFGPNEDIPVNLVTLNQHLADFHNNLAAAVESGGGVIESSYVKELYRPHISHVENLQAQPGDVYKLDEISLLQLLPDENTCRIIKNYKLKAKA